MIIVPTTLVYSKLMEHARSKKTDHNNAAKARHSQPAQDRGTKVVRSIILGVLLIAALLFAGLGIRSCFVGSQTLEIEELVPYYPWEGFLESDDRFSFIFTDEETEATTNIAKTGIDVSDHQGWIDWEAVASDGIQFAFIRLGYRGMTEGEIYPDEYYEYNITAAKQAHIECGVYFFSQAITEEEAKEEAQFVLDMLNGTTLEYPVVFDFEKVAPDSNSRIHDLSSEEATAIALAFCKAIEKGGYKAMLYGNMYDIERYDMDKLSDYPVWYAEYGALPSYAKEFTIWQYSSTGSVKGIETVVDMNIDLTNANTPMDMPV